MSRRTIMMAAIVGALLAGALAIQESHGEEPKSGMVYELRTYTTLPGRLPALNKRFADHTLKLFEKHGMKNIMYWTPTDPAQAENTLIYVIAHDSPEAAKKSWAAFQADPDWQKAKAASEADGKIVDKVTSVYMKATDYSPSGK